MGLDNKKDTPFNMAMLFYMSLNKFIVDKNIAYIKGDLWTWYRTLVTIYRQIIFKIEKEEKENIEVLLKKAQGYLNKTPPSAMKDQFLSISERRIEEALDKVDKKLTNIMDSNNMIFPQIEVTGGFDTIKKELNL